MVEDLCLGVLNEGHSVRDINDTIVTLIPKVNETERVRDFRPISLCNVVYKVIAK